MLTIFAYYLLYGALALVGLMAVFASHPLETADFYLFIKYKLLKERANEVQTRGDQAAAALKFILLWPFALFMIGLIALLYYLELTKGPNE